jgi:hypothetical protein
MRADLRAPRETALRTQYRPPVNYPRRVTRLIAVVILTIAGLAAAGASAMAHAGTQQPSTPVQHAGVAAASARVSARPASGTPQLALTSRTQTVRQIARCGSRMYAVGSFTTIKWRGTTYRRRNAFSFSAGAPYRVTSWRPGVNGTVNSITFSRDCSRAYLGGQFTRVHERVAANIAEVSARTGDVVRAFRHNASGTVETVLRHGSHVLAGGFFTKINGSTADPYLASLNQRSGKDDGYARLHIFGHYVYPGVDGNRTRIYNQQLSHDGNYDLVEGDFTSVGGRPRQQIFMLHFGTSHASVTGWTSPDFSNHCAAEHPFYVQAAAWSPGDRKVYVATTGYHPLGWDHTFPLHGLCDAAAAYPARLTAVHRQWTDYTGCDSLYAVAADASTVYIGGHERWAQNKYGCDSAGPGAVSAPGMGGLSPKTGHLVFNPTRSRGHGADDMLVTRSGLWIASDTFAGSQTCGGVAGHAGICFLPR